MVLGCCFAGRSVPLTHRHPNDPTPQAEGCDPIDCVAVEDSGSGVGSAANAGMGAWRQRPKGNGPVLERRARWNSLCDSS